MQLAQFPLAVPYLLNPVGIVGLMTISAEAKSLSVFAVEFGILVLVLLIDVLVFRWANRVSDKLDESRMLVTEKVFGFLIAAIAVRWSWTAWPRSGSSRRSRTAPMASRGRARCRAPTGPKEDGCVRTESA